MYTKFIYEKIQIIEVNLIVRNKGLIRIKNVIKYSKLMNKFFFYEKNNI